MYDEFSPQSCRLDDCLTDYTRLELLTDCICRMCSMGATVRRLEQEAERLAESAQEEQHASSSKKKRVREAKKLAARARAALAEGRIEEEIKGVKMEKVFSKASTKQAMIARVGYDCYFQRMYLETDAVVLASTSLDAPSEPLLALRCIRRQKYLPCIIPRVSRPYTLYHIRQTINSTLHTHLLSPIEPTPIRDTHTFLT